ncbi:MAG: hypothetical protein C4532_09175 [Candidatus Abyssobacteria bacterium SURF_17]|uniref:Zinc-finger domain-containing protein n=1 Tax=Candidatus Abyssobacteria bacterium SURF_17 TaxID=2093361 RepID=A0A419EYZ4_9BACT|nr:MAG: hypothetical protein C4532_09175 [Candidatus Abyssubacteria bacterium SURF_17]
MHPSRDDLRHFVDGQLSDSRLRTEIARHLEFCEFCADFCADYRDLTQPLPTEDPSPLSEAEIRLRERLRIAALPGTVIDLLPLTAETSDLSEPYMAADGLPAKKPDITNLATLFSEEPEIVLRVMRDSALGRDYLQVVAADTEMAAHVMVCLPDLGCEFVTDASGRADLDLSGADNIDRLKWQIRMPEAVFSLEPLQYDPERIEYAEEIILETERRDRIEIRFEGRTDGKQLVVRVLEIDGNREFTPVRVLVSQSGRNQLATGKPGRTVEFGPIDASTSIQIRLYS